MLFSLISAQSASRLSRGRTAAHFSGSCVRNNPQSVGLKRLRIARFIRLPRHPVADRSEVERASDSSLMAL